MTESAKGFWAIIAACCIWGLSSLYYKQLAHISPLEVLAHRSLWSFAFFIALIALQGRLKDVLSVLVQRRNLVITAAAGLMISYNWFIFVYAIQIGRAMDASLGYFICPLFAVGLGAIVLGERLGRVQWGAIAAMCIAVLGLTLATGILPWIAVTVALTLALYGVLKRWINAGPLVSVTAEVTLLAPVALLLLLGIHTRGWGTGVFGSSLFDSLMLVFSGPLTAIPLVLFSYAAKRIHLSTLGLSQYLNPSLQFLIATLVFGEIFSLAHAMAFGMIWTALAVYSISSLRQERKPVIEVIKSGTELTTVNSLAKSGAAKP